MEIIYQTLDDAQNITNENLKKVGKYIMNETMQNIYESYINYNSKIEEYRELKVDTSLEQEIKSNFKSLMESISDYLGIIYSNYIENKNEIIIEINKKIDGNLVFTENFNKELNAENKIKITQSSFDNISNIIESLKNYTKDISSNILQKSRNQVINNKRKLQEYQNSYYIKAALNDFKIVYNSMKDKIINIKQYIDLTSSYHLFFSKMITGIRDISSYINHTYTYLNEISNSTKLDDYFSNIETQVETIRNLSNEFLVNESLIIDNTLHLLRYGIIKIYSDIENDLLKDVDFALKTLFSEILNKEPKNETKKGTYEKIDISVKNETAFTEVFGNITDINYNYNYSFNFYNDSIILGIFLNASVNGITEEKVDIMSEIFNGTFGNGLIGLRVNYSLYDERAYAFAFVNHSKCYYDSSLKFEPIYYSIFKDLNEYNVKKVTNSTYIEIEKKY